MKTLSFYPKTETGSKKITIHDFNMPIKHLSIAEFTINDLISGGYEVRNEIDLAENEKDEENTNTLMRETLIFLKDIAKNRDIPFDIQVRMQDVISKALEDKSNNRYVLLEENMVDEDEHALFTAEIPYLVENNSITNEDGISLLLEEIWVIYRLETTNKRKEEGLK